MSRRGAGAEAENLVRHVLWEKEKKSSDGKVDEGEDEGEEAG